MEGKGLKLSSSFYFADYVRLLSQVSATNCCQSKIISRFKSCAIEFFFKTFQFFKAGKDCFQIYFFTAHLLKKELVLFNILVA